MFNPNQPYNTLPLLPTKYNFDNIQILKEVNHANIDLAKLNTLASKLPDSSLLISPLLVRESVASSGIENINTTVKEALEAEIMPEEKRKGAAKEVLHYRNAMNFGLDLVRKKGFIATNDFIHIQKIVEPNKTGIRKGEVKIVNDTTGEVLFTPPNEEKYLRDLLKNLEDFANNHEDDIDPLIKLSVFHYQFESIHPFMDGNGRVGRLLCILYLVMTQRLDFPVLFLSGYIYKYKAEYYKILRKTNQTNDFTDLILYFLKAVRIQSKETVDTVKKIEKLMEKFRTTIEKKMNVYTYGLTECMFSKPILTIDYIQQSMKLSSRQTASKYLANLKDIGLLKEEKIGLHKIFYSKEFIDLLS